MGDGSKVALGAVLGALVVLLLFGGFTGGMGHMMVRLHDGRWCLGDAALRGVLALGLGLGGGGGGLVLGWHPARVAPAKPAGARSTFEQRPTVPPEAACPLAPRDPLAPF